MLDDVTPPEEENMSSWRGLFKSRTDILMLGIGGLFLIYNIVLFFGVNVRLVDWLSYLNMRYWSLYTAFILWAGAIWVISRLTDWIENYQPHIWASWAIGFLLVIIFELRSFFNDNDFYPQGYPIWLNTVVVLAVCCAVRSLILIYYWYVKDESVDLEEAQWFWGLSGLFCVGLLTVTMMSMIPIKSEDPNDIFRYYDQYTDKHTLLYRSLFHSYYNGLQGLVQTGRGPFGLRMFGLLILAVPITFVYVAGKWVLIFLSRFWQE